jgi:hypothetical protein
MFRTHRKRRSIKMLCAESASLKAGLQGSSHDKPRPTQSARIELSEAAMSSFNVGLDDASP